MRQQPPQDDGPGNSLYRGTPWDLAGFHATMASLGLSLDRPKDDWNSDVAKSTMVNSVYFRPDASVRDQVAWRDATARFTAIADSLRCPA